MGIHGIRPGRVVVYEGRVDAMRDIRWEQQPGCGINIKHSLRLGRVSIWRGGDVQGLRMRLVGNTKREKLTWRRRSIDEGQYLNRSVTG
jgi:hypothetical protein